MELQKPEKILIIGGRRGLGRQIVEEWRRRFPAAVLLVSSRKQFEIPEVRAFQADLSRSEDVHLVDQLLTREIPDRVFYCAGGGPHGAFADKDWKDHEWALKVTLLSPLELMHRYLKLRPRGQWIVIGSAIAESQPDANAASYAAAKHGLLGALSSIRAENSSCDLRLFSPGYMDTDLLPAHAAPRRSPEQILDPHSVAIEFVEWALDAKAPWHRSCLPRKVPNPSGL